MRHALWLMEIVKGAQLRLVVGAGADLGAVALRRGRDGELPGLGELVVEPFERAQEERAIAAVVQTKAQTQDTAFMFVPSESVYAELYERFEDVIQKSHRERVIIASFAPKPFIHPTATGDWTKAYLEHGFPETKATYRLFGAEENVAAVRFDAGHNYNKNSREAVYTFFNQHLNLGHPTPDQHSPLQQLPLIPRQHRHQDTPLR